MGENYHQWSRSMMMSLISKHKLELVDGSILMPTKTGPTFNQWQRANNLVTSWIMRSVSPSIAQSILWIDKAYEVWDELRERFLQENMFHIAELQESIANFKQGELDITNYFTELKILWDEFDTCRPLPTCDCEFPATCSAMKNTKAHKSEDKIIRFLKGLNDSYGTIRSQILLMDPLPTMSKVLSLIGQQDRQLTGQDDAKVMSTNANWRKGSAPERGPNAVKANFGKGTPEQTSYVRENQTSTNKTTYGKGASTVKFCTHYKKSGHTFETCYRIHGFPPNFQFTRSEKRNTSMTCDTRGKDLAETDKNETFFGLGQQQYEGLVHMLKKSNTIPTKGNNSVMSTNTTLTAQKTENEKGTSNSECQYVSWILDNGATNHISASLSIFSTYHRIRYITVNLPNNSIVIAYI
ncbi:PREDICTED: uncharacterized protein LOC109352934 [Lupinus angustifolius]|uniref:uncharacterized protein LOC109352934 n=1 Tax=Lupinus angustifolius TaxID=3871 RepID=UPI00092F5F95|nr:PREDICTED: uncharacterized protein LOC109352934 [Lupinus angustifolius]